MAANAGAEESSAPAPFIVGAPKSGTTLLRLMLDSHPELAIPPETHFIPRIAQRLGWGTDGRRPTSPRFFARFFSLYGVHYQIYSSRPEIPDLRRLFLEAVQETVRWPDFHVDPEALSSRILPLEPFDVGRGLRVFYRLYAERFGKARWGDKTPRYRASMRLIQGLLPEARMIHLVRDGRDVALSLREVWFGTRSIEKAALDWKAAIEVARREAKSLRHYMEIRFEDLILDPARTLKQICEFIEIAWHPAMLDYHLQSRERLQELRAPLPARDGRPIAPAERIATHTMATREPDPEKIGVWKSRMAPADRKKFEALAGDLLEDLEYAID
jgi:hypothetical protein